MMSGRSGLPNMTRTMGWGRRGVLQSLAGVAALAAVGPSRARADGMTVRGPAEPFDFDVLTARARRAAAAPYQPHVSANADFLSKIDYDAHWRIRFRDAASLSPAGPAAPVQLFFPGRYFQTPVKIHLVERGQAQEVRYSRDYFDMPADSPAQALPEDLGFAGFRIMRPGLRPDWMSFLGASYFRTDGPEGQYGLSARGIAIDTGLDRAEEFPSFTAFWLAAPEDPDDDLTAYAMLDGPSVTGAYRFGLRRGGKGEGHRTTVAARLFFRNGVERLGIAPLTGMYWYSERDRSGANDWRPEIHDSDGLALATGAGERIWRPLFNPERVTTSSFFDDDPRGFGLIQRDRRFENYQDDGAFYHRRPSAWITPLGDWGRGAVQLVEIPTRDETFDNIVAYWTPHSQPAAGAALTYDYAIDWIARDPMLGRAAAVVATYQGHGGAPGQPIPPGVDKIVIDFAGPSLRGLDVADGVEPIVEARGGAVLEPIAARPVVGADRWRLSFDFQMAGPEPVELRAYLRKDGQALTETWLAQAVAGKGRR